MMNLSEANSTVLQRGNDGWGNLFLYGCYFFLGLVIGSGNVVIVCAVLKYKALRTSKVHVILMALALSDALNMLAHVFGGTYRAIKVFNGTHSAMMRAWECMFTVHSIIWSFVHSQSTLMLAVVSLDRLISVTLPFKYISLPASYAKWMVAVTYLYTWSVGALGIGLTYHTRNGKPDQVSAACIPPQAFNYSNKLYARYFALAPVAFCIVSIILYIGVWVEYKHQMAQVDKSMSKHTRYQKVAEERRVTKTLGLCSFCTFWFYLVPWLAGNVTTWLGYSSVNFVFWVMAMINPACNIFIYPLRMREMRKAIKGLFTGKILPSNLELWPTAVFVKKKYKKKNKELDVVELEQVSKGVQYNVQNDVMLF